MVEGVFQMKNKIKLLAVIAMVALIGFSMTACDSSSITTSGVTTTTDSGNTVSGTYRYSDSSGTFAISFDDYAKTFTMNVNESGKGSYVLSGTYKVTGKIITCTVSASQNLTFTIVDSRHIKSDNFSITLTKV
jgi:hypothetical protein